MLASSQAALAELAAENALDVLQPLLQLFDLLLKAQLASQRDSAVEGLFRVTVVSGGGARGVGLLV